MKVVVALGGNALENEQDDRSFDGQMRNVRRACEDVVDLIELGHRPIITHGNGPQVGDLLLQQECAREEVPERPLHLLGAMTQGEIGSMLQCALQGMLARQDGTTPVASVITHTLVDKGDPAFGAPSKPVGPFYDRETAERLASKKGFSLSKVEPGGSAAYRRVVPSPEPIRIVEASVIERLVELGVTPICVGGGGIPVSESGDGGLEGVEGVIDKDLATERLAEEVGADGLLILTDVDGVKLDYGKPNERSVRRMTLAQAEERAAEGHFLPGTMLPKVTACTRFVRSGGSFAAIARLGGASAAVRGSGGTRFTR